MPDIDNDSEASKKQAIVQRMKDYFGEDKVLNVATFSKISAKTAIERACKGLGISADTAGYLKSLIPVNRGKVSKLKDCVYGNEEKGIKPVTELVNEMKQYPNLTESALALEGLITNRGTHAAGVIVCNNPYTDYIAAMRSADGTLETCYDLWDSEEAGCIKFDMLTTVCADKIHKTMDGLIASGHITWEGSLKATYYKWIHPDVLNYTDKDMWAILPSIYSVFQFDTPISQKTLGVTHPQSVMDLSAANSLLRLMPDGADETPIDRYTRYKESHEAWVKDTVDFGLNDDERAILWHYLADSYGMAESQEKVMRLSMDEHTAGYTLKEANKLRKSIAKKDEKLQAEAKALFFECCERQGTREVFADYIWNVVFAASMGYSFSQLHSYSYSIIALQELNLNYFYPRVYWNCACLSIEATGLTDTSTENGKTKGADYGEVAKAIYKMKNNGIEIDPPDINESGINFSPQETTNSILFGLGGISGINPQIAQQIIDNRPYKSFAEFVHKNTFEGSLVTKSKFVQLIKGGCFDKFCPDRAKVMRRYAKLTYEPKEKLELNNIAEIKRVGVKIPKEVVGAYNYRKYVCSPRFLYGNHPNFKSKKLYRIAESDDKAFDYFVEKVRPLLVEDTDYWWDKEELIIVDKSLEKALKPSIDNLKLYINTPDFINTFNEHAIDALCYELTKGDTDVNRWSFQALTYYSHDHELSGLDFGRYDIAHYDDLPEEPTFVERNSHGRSWKEYEIYRIAGTVIGRVDSHNIVTILTVDNEVINCKMHQGLFAHYKQTISEKGEDGKAVVLDPSWLTRGVRLMVVGYRVGQDEFRVKRYSRSVYQHSLTRIDKVLEDGSALLTSERYDDRQDEN